MLDFELELQIEKLNRSKLELVLERNGIEVSPEETAKELREIVKNNVSAGEISAFDIWN